jgi:branched-chain amino acid transport system permease protein
MRTLPRRLAVAIIVAAIVAILSVKLNAFRDYQIAEIAVYVTAVAGLTVLTGLSGQISLGNGAFMAIGAYATALLVIHLGWPFYAVLLASGALAAGAGGGVGRAPARRRCRGGHRRGQAARPVPRGRDPAARRGDPVNRVRLPGDLRR